MESASHTAGQSKHSTAQGPAATNQAPQCAICPAQQQFTEFSAGWLLHSCTYCYKDDLPHQALGLGIQQGRGSEDLHSLDEEVEAQG